MHLVISKDQEELRRSISSLLSQVKEPLTSFYPDNFSIEDFVQEVETLPFFSTKKAVLVHAIDQLSAEELEAIRRYIEKPNPWISLYLTAAELSPQAKLLKLIEKTGEVLRFKEEKPWDKERRLSAWLIDEAKKAEVHLSPQAATALIKRVDPQTLKVELDKLICFAGPSGEITLDAISALSTFTHHETLWQLGDALFARATGRALEIGKTLLEEGIAIYMLLASLRSQFMMGLEMLTSGGEKFPNLKGAFLEKKLQVFKTYGKSRLQRGALLIFETEIKAKNSSTDPSLLLELLISKL